MKTWKFILKLIIAILTAILGVLGTQAAMNTFNL